MFSIRHIETFSLCLPEEWEGYLQLDTEAHAFSLSAAFFCDSYTVWLPQHNRTIKMHEMQ